MKRPDDIANAPNKREFRSRFCQTLLGFKDASSAYVCLQLVSQHYKDNEGDQVKADDQKEKPGSDHQMPAYKRVPGSHGSNDAEAADDENDNGSQKHEVRQ